MNSKSIRYYSQPNVKQLLNQKGKCDTLKQILIEHPGYGCLLNSSQINLIIRESIGSTRRKSMSYAWFQDLSKLMFAFPFSKKFTFNNFLFDCDFDKNGKYYNELLIFDLISFLFGNKHSPSVYLNGYDKMSTILNKIEENYTISCDDFIPSFIFEKCLQLHLDNGKNTQIFYKIFELFVEFARKHKLKLVLYPNPELVIFGGDDINNNDYNYNYNSNHHISIVCRNIIKDYHDFQLQSSNSNSNISNFFHDERCECYSQYLWMVWKIAATSYVTHMFMCALQLLIEWEKNSKPSKQSQRSNSKAVAIDENFANDLKPLLDIVFSTFMRNMSDSISWLFDTSMYNFLSKNDVQRLQKSWVIKYLITECSKNWQLFCTDDDHDPATRSNRSISTELDIYFLINFGVIDCDRGTDMIQLLRSSRICRVAARTPTVRIVKALMKEYVQKHKNYNLDQFKTMADIKQRCSSMIDSSGTYTTVDHDDSDGTYSHINDKLCMTYFICNILQDLQRDQVLDDLLKLKIFGTYQVPRDILTIIFDYKDSIVARELELELELKPVEQSNKKDSESFAIEWDTFGEKFDYFPKILNSSLKERNIIVKLGDHSSNCWKKYFHEKRHFVQIGNNQTICKEVDKILIDNSICVVHGYNYQIKRRE